MGDATLIEAYGAIQRRDITPSATLIRINQPKIIANSISDARVNAVMSAIAP
jgi:hypothetical protein